MSFFRSACLIFLLVLLAGCFPPSNAPSRGSTLVYSRGEDANTLDPIHTDIGETVKVIVNLYDTLVAYDDLTTEIKPSLAESWSVSDDGLSWTFQLREGVVFHDGSSFNAEAVKFSFDRLIMPTHPHVYEPGRPYQPSYSMIESVVASGEYEVKFQLHKPSAVFFGNLAMFAASIVSPAAVKQHGAGYKENPSGTGPFQLVKWNRDQQLVLGAFEKHWRGAPGVKNVVFLPVRESATRIQQIKRGEAHIVDDLPPAEMDVLATNPDLVIQEQQSLNVGYLTTQTEKPPLNDRRVRLAIARAIDKTEYVRVVFGGRADPAKTLVPPAMWGHHADLIDHEFNVAAAKELLAEAANELKFELPLKLTLCVMSQPRPYLQQPKAAAEFVKDSLAKIGIEVAVETRDVNQHFPHLMAGKHELALAGWTSDNNDPDNFLFSLLDSDNIGNDGNNLSRFRHDRFHELIHLGQRTINPEERLKFYREAQEIALAEAPVVPLAHSQIRIAQRKNVKDYVLHPSSLVRLRLARLEESSP